MKGSGSGRGRGTLHRDIESGGVDLTPEIHSIYKRSKAAPCFVYSSSTVVSPSISINRLPTHTKSQKVFHFPPFSPISSWFFSEKNRRNVGTPGPQQAQIRQQPTKQGQPEHHHQGYGQRGNMASSSSSSTSTRPAKLYSQQQQQERD